MHTGVRLAMLAVALRIGAGAAGALCVDAVPLPWASPETPAACASADACCSSASVPADRLPPTDPDCCVDVPIDCWPPPEPADPLMLPTAARMADPLASPAAGPSVTAYRALARLRAPPPPWVGVILLQV